MYNFKNKESQQIINNTDQITKVLFCFLSNFVRMLNLDYHQLFLLADTLRSQHAFYKNKLNSLHNPFKCI